MKVSIIEAGGNVAKSLVSMILAQRLMASGDVLQLVEEREPRSFHVLEALRSDLLDSVGVGAEQLELAFGPEGVDGDVVVVTLGIAYSLGLKGDDKKAIYSFNLDQVLKYARSIRARGVEPLFVVASEPMEATVELLTRYFPRQKVVGIGSLLDSLRFRKEIALTLGIPRSHVHAMVVGEHGPCMVPLWSSVRILGMSKEDTRETINRLRKGWHYSSSCLVEAWGDVMDLVSRKSPAEISKVFNELPLCVKLFMRPWLAYQMGVDSFFGPAGAVFRLLAALLRGEPFFGPLQMRLEGEFYGIDTVFGVPLVLTINGILGMMEIPLWEEERVVLEVASEGIRRRLKELLPE